MHEKESEWRWKGEREGQERVAKEKGAMQKLKRGAGKAGGSITNGERKPETRVCAAIQLHQHFPTPHLLRGVQLL